LDYEGTALDLSLNWRLRGDILIGVDSRIISYYGGLFDPVIEGWHNFFGFPNGGREYYSKNDVFVNIDNGSGRDISLSHPLVGLGDMDFYGIWTFYSEPFLNMAAAGAVKLPTGSLSSGTGSNFIDLGCQFLSSWEFHPLWMVHFQQGLVLPGDLWTPVGENYASFISSQTFLAIQFMPRYDWSLILQTRINTSPLFSDQIRYTTLWGASPLFTMPQTSLQAGFKKAWKTWALQVHIEEDPLTYEGLDILFSVKITRFFHNL
jgi:hypothetical protein